MNRALRNVLVAVAPLVVVAACHNGTDSTAASHESGGKPPESAQVSATAPRASGGGRLYDVRPLPEFYSTNQLGLPVGGQLQITSVTGFQLNERGVPVPGRSIADIDGTKTETSIEGSLDYRKNDGGTQAPSHVAIIAFTGYAVVIHADPLTVSHA